MLSKQTYPTGRVARRLRLPDPEHSCSGLLDAARCTNRSRVSRRNVCRRSHTTLISLETRLFPNMRIDTNHTEALNRFLWRVCLLLDDYSKRSLLWCLSGPFTNGSRLYRSDAHFPFSSRNQRAVLVVQYIQITHGIP
jgi:hypothetical protein